MPPEKKHGPNPKGVAGSKFVNGEERGQNPKEWPVSQSDGERLKVVYLVMVVDKEARGGALSLGGFSVGCRKQRRRRRRRRRREVK